MARDPSIPLTKCETACGKDSTSRSTFCTDHTVKWLESPEFADYKENGQSTPEWEKYGEDALQKFIVRMKREENR
jgi:hypothetical protein